jgi:hypothetical protein
MGGNPDPKGSPPPAPTAPLSHPDAPAPTPSGAWVQQPNGSWSWVTGAKPAPAAVGQYGSSTLTDVAWNPDGQMNTGSWYQLPATWKWVPGATPDPTLAKLYGTGALTNPKDTPDGVVNRDPNADSGPGAWEPQTLSGTWQWGWNMSPDPALEPPGVTTAQLTNPNQAPDGTPGPADPSSPYYAPQPNVAPPTVVDIWGTTAPDVTGQPPTGTGMGGGGGSVSAPPTVANYLVSPGSIRDAENTLLTALYNQQIPDYNALKAYVAQTSDQNLYSAGMTKAYLSSIQTHLLQGVADVLTLAGEWVATLNNAAQNYAAGDKNSFIPED